jgi:hypothetical protein
MTSPDIQRNAPALAFDAGVFRSRFDTPHGRALWALVNEPECVHRMEALSDIGKSAVWALEQPLLRAGLMATKAQIGKKDKADWERDKQMMGRMVKVVMESRGYALQPTSLKFGGLIFSSGSTYRKQARA